MKHLMKIFSFILLLFIAGCAEREICITYSPNCSLTQDGFTCENDTVKVTYDFWAENGMMCMHIYNKLNVPVFIDWKISNFIDNNNNMQYWYDVQSSTSVTKGVSYYGLQAYTGVPMKIGHSVTNTNTERPDRITSITPHSEITKAMYSLIPRTTFFKNGNYESNNSPVNFRSYLAFSMDEKFAQKFYADNEFYVGQVETMKEGQFEKYNKASGHGVSYSPYNNPRNFYTEKLK
jgi:hypothetical protein